MSIAIRLWLAHRAGKYRRFGGQPAIENRIDDADLQSEENSMHTKYIHFPCFPVGLVIAVATLLSGCRLTERLAFQTPVVIQPSEEKCACSSCSADAHSSTMIAADEPATSGPKLYWPQGARTIAPNFSEHYPPSSPPVDPGHYFHAANPQPIPAPTLESAEQQRISELMALQTKQSAQLRQSVDALYAEVVASRKTTGDVVSALKMVNDEMFRVTNDVKNWKEEVRKKEQNDDAQHRSELTRIQAITDTLKQIQTQTDAFNIPAPSLPAESTPASSTPVATPSQPLLTPGTANE